MNGKMTPARSKARTWRGFRAHALRSPVADRYEPLRAETWSSVKLYVPKNAPRFSLFFTRRYLCQLWVESGDFPERLFAMVRYGLPTRAYFELIKLVADRARRPLGFVGDLDPFDLTTFLALRSGDPDLRRPAHRALELSYRGIDDRWLELCERHLLPRWKGALPLIKMSSLEQEHAELIIRLAPWLLELTGPRCAGLLRSGMKLELEGASNPAFYGNGFPKRLLAHLLLRSRQDPEKHPSH